MGILEDRAELAFRRRLSGTLHVDSLLSAVWPPAKLTLHKLAVPTSETFAPRSFSLFQLIQPHRPLALRISANQKTLTAAPRTL